MRVASMTMGYSMESLPLEVKQRLGFSMDTMSMPTILTLVFRLAGIMLTLVDIVSLITC
jgi:hypothetical protein